MKGLKKFLIFAWVWLASLWIFSTQNVYAQWSWDNTVQAAKTWESTKALEEWGHTLEAILAMLYGIMWPLIAIAWTALSNDIVFWKIFYRYILIF